MFDGDRRSLEKMAPKLKRVLIADPTQASARLFSDIMRDIARSHGGDIALGESSMGGLRATVRVPL